MYTWKVAVYYMMYNTHVLYARSIHTVQYLCFTHNIWNANLQQLIASKSDGKLGKSQSWIFFWTKEEQENKSSK
jgi:hypothetical protein